MPIYEFECQDCEAEFDAMAAVGTEAVACPECGSAQTKRRYSPPATFRVVKTPGEARKQEQRNAKLHQDTKRRFKESRRKAREARKAKGDGGGE